MVVFGAPAPPAVKGTSNAQMWMMTRLFLFSMRPIPIFVVVGSDDLIDHICPTANSFLRTGLDCNGATPTQTISVKMTEKYLNNRCLRYSDRAAQSGPLPWDWLRHRQHFNAR